MHLPRPSARPRPDLAALTALFRGDPDRAFEVVEVYTGTPIARVPRASAADVAAAFDAARTAQHAWAERSVADRLRVFRRFHRLVLRRHALISDVIQLETGKARRMAFEEMCDLPILTSHYLRRADRILRPVRHPGAVPGVTEAVELRHPLGVVGVISPWNFPFAIALCDAIPALMAGNAVVLKPDPHTPLSAALAVSLLREAGLPPELVQLVCDDGADGPGGRAVTGPAVVEQADFVMFTGSLATGRRVAARAAERVVPSCLELGGKNPMIVLRDADLDEVVASAVLGVFGNSGQLCLHMERIYVEDEVYDRFRDLFVERVGRLRVAAGYDFEAEMGALANPAHLARVAAHVDEAVAAGARVLVGGRARPDLGPTFYEPTVLEGVAPGMRVHAEETFGPVVALYRFTDVEEAIRLANDSEYGLNASVWSADHDVAMAVAAQLQTGHVNINDSAPLGYATKSAPSGGAKASGLGVRNGDEGLLKFTYPTTVATLRKQVLAPPEGTPYAAHVRRTLTTLAWMRRLRLR
ncbi:aldehyde dehydrogenase family protein [Nocardioides sp. GY 10113]|uniref:succinic semialdehyde dehydrogenase n=1 Tax=Nocardioides sp. GY 10113 TaxID=2569761 RepID=UPI0010A80EBF|nr:succinic semialdehyde dehydrogenase [Nocardioides sp. GY 10113]TIC88557.1 aldehyde dehydrogenase family protein [Nocardioides sp. GY 10113]